MRPTADERVLLLKMCSLVVGETAQWVRVLAVIATGLELKFQTLM